MNSDYPSPTGDETRAVDEQCLYGEPCHEPRDTADGREQALYGKPQHEPTRDADGAQDIELLFVRMQSDAIGPKSLGSRESAAAETSE